jgi:hypothetical protein
MSSDYVSFIIKPIRDGSWGARKSEWRGDSGTLYERDICTCSNSTHDCPSVSMATDLSAIQAQVQRETDLTKSVINCGTLR